MSDAAPPVKLLYPEYWNRLEGYVERELAAYRTFGAIAMEAGVATMQEIELRSHTVVRVTYCPLFVDDGPDIREVTLSELRHDTGSHQIIQPKFAAQRIGIWDEAEGLFTTPARPDNEHMPPRPTMKVRKGTGLTTLKSLNQLLCADMIQMERDQDYYLKWLYVVRTSLGIHV